MLAVASLRCIGIANVAAGAVARPTASVIPAARVLRNIAAECSLVTDLRRRHQFRGLRQQTILLLDDGMIHHLGERGHGADLDTIAGRANSAQFLDSAQIDHSLRLLDSIFQPVEAVETSGQHQGVRSVLCEKPLRVSDGTRLVQLERGHYVSNDSHTLLQTSIKYAPSAHAASVGPLRATSESCRRSQERAGKSRPPAHPRGRSRRRRTHLQPAARRHRARQPAFPGPEYPTPSIAY